MIINNQKQAVNLRIQKSLALLVVVIVVALIYFTNALPPGTMGLSKNQFAIAFVSVFLVYFLVDYLRNYHYIYFSDTGDIIILRYYSLRPLEDKKNAIEFNKREFHNFRINRLLNGFNESLVIFRKTPKGIAKYPPVSITALPSNEKKRLIASLDKLARANQSSPE